MQAVSGSNRQKESRRKFFNGLYVEYSGIAFINNNYIEEHDFIKKIEEANQLIDNPEKEHHLYKIGSIILKNKKPDKTLIKIRARFDNDDEFKKYRYHNLVKLGAIIENHGLNKINKATMIGAFKYIDSQNENN